VRAESGVLTLSVHSPANFAAQRRFGPPDDMVV
jgi:hypothetical protein